MTVARVLFQLARADFLERVRRHSFLVTLGFTVFAAYLFLPPNHAKYATLNLAGHRGIYNSAWVGSLVAMLSVTFLSLAGFYLVRNAVERDRRTGVGQVLAATPLSRPLYLLGKLASNFAVLATMVAVLAVAAAVMQLVRGEDPRLAPIALLEPFLFVTLPVMALIAAIALCFEVTPGLRGGLGNVVFFVLWMSSLSLSAARRDQGVDILANRVVIREMQAACARAYPDYPGGGALSMGFNIKGQGVWDLRTFVWEGARWTPAMIAERAAWPAAAVALTLLAALGFDRFDARAPLARYRPRGRGRPPVAEPPAPEPRDRPGRPAPESILRPTGPAPAGGRSRLDGLVAAELRIMLKGISRWWWVVVLGLTLASLLVPLAGVTGFVLPFALIWPLLLWSPMGTREQGHRTDALLFSAPRPVTRLLVAQWLAGAALALAVAGGGLVRLAISGQWSGVAALLAAVAFIPSMALALGVWSGSGRLFEVLYLILWYMGPMNRIPPLDFVGTTQPAAGGAPVVTFLALGAALAALALLGRRRQLAR